MNVIFLDVDGELTYSDYENENTANIDIEKVLLLKEICDKTNSKVVISSSWRGSENYTPKIYYILIDILTQNNIEVIGDTPYIKSEYDNIQNTKKVYSVDDLLSLKLKYGTGRAAEIQKYINEHNVNNFVILDDEDWNWSEYGFDKHWIQPTWFGNGGLKSEHVIQAINIMNNNYKEVN